ncbi:monocarboxylate transporter 13-like isoform X2 [Acanthaster planci]|uniref:Monocarboxylate transporter 13-like isoform X2 n=1 Tax=Acanthaster planci TaxID=133434 RepID=A0A8B7YFG7_ACAPL|nr:monocarboxylate transporter 13-like isoform X2 [Acanthaster planci]
MCNKWTRICFVVEKILFTHAPLSGKAATTRCGSRPFVMAGGVCNLAGLLVCSSSTSIGLLFVGMTLLGIGFTMSYAPLMITVVMYFPTRFALANGVLSTGAAVGMMVIPPLVELLIKTYGWPNAMAVLAAVNFNVTACGALVRPPLGTHQRLINAADEADTSTDPNLPHISLLRSVVVFLKDIPEKLSLDIFILAPAYSVYLLIWFLNGVIFSAWLIYLIPHAISKGIDARLASFLATAGGIGNLVVRVVHGPAIDRGLITALKLLILLSVLNAIAFFVDMVSYDYYHVLVILAIVNGAAVGIIGVVVMPVAQEVLIEPDLSVKGYLLSLPILALGELCGGVFAGAFYEMIGNYNLAFVSLGGLSTVIAIAIIAERTYAVWSK